ncbi:MAG: CRISPR-associated endonuclease Cas2 [Bacteroidota bacterium]
MYYSVSYDISSTKTRLLAVKLCKKAGLARLQRSVFMGSSLPALISDIEQQLKPLLHPKTDSLCIVPLDADTFTRLVLHGNQTDKKTIARERKVVFV